MSLRRCVFAGPSLSRAEIGSEIVCFAPAQLGGIYFAAKAGFKVIGLIDGIFGNVPTVWHKEILYAMSQGCVVCGSASMGALRAAELHTYGMHGIGLCYRLYRAAVITDDDEVAVLHGDATTGYTSFTEALVSARITLRRLRWAGEISVDQEQETVSRFKALHFSQRSFAEYKRELVAAFGAGEGKRIEALLTSRYRDVKRADARQLVQYVLGATPPATARNYFVRTGAWRHQFERHEHELKPLE